MIVGGRQYRVGSGRFFVVAARALAQRGVPVLRFDSRGMGDSDGAIQSFTEQQPDIQAAVDRMHAEIPGLTGKFMANWAGRPVGDLFDYVSRAMPQPAASPPSTKQGSAACSITSCRVHASYSF